MDNWTLQCVYEFGSFPVYLVIDENNREGILKLMEEGEKKVNIAMHDLSIAYPYFVRTLNGYDLPIEAVCTYSLYVDIRYFEPIQYHCVMEMLCDIPEIYYGDQLMINTLHIILGLYIAKDSVRLSHKDYQILWRKYPSDMKDIHIQYKDIDITLPLVFHKGENYLPVIYDYGFSTVHAEIKDRDIGKALYPLISVGKITDTSINAAYEKHEIDMVYDADDVREIFQHLLSIYE